METASQIASRFMHAVLAPLSGRSATLSLLVFGILAGIGMLWVFRRISNPAAIGRAKARISAHLYEMRLFADDPVIIWKAQWGLVKANIRYLGAMLLPTVVLCVPMLLVFSELQCFYGYRPLAPGRDAILTVQLKTAEGVVPKLRAPDGIAVETAGVRVDGGRQISWRVRALRPVSGNFEIAFADETVGKSVDAGAGPRYLSVRRESAAGELIWHPAESLLQSRHIDWIELRYPEAGISVFGWELPWLAWLMVFSMLTAFALKRRFGVMF